MSPDVKSWSRDLCLIGGLLLLLTASAGAETPPAVSADSRKATVKGAEDARKKQLEEVNALLKKARDLRRRALAIDLKNVEWKSVFAEADITYLEAWEKLEPPVRAGETPGVPSAPARLPGEAAERMRTALAKERLDFAGEWSRRIMASAEAAFAEKRYDDALAISSEAILIDNRQAKAVERLAERCRKALAKDDYREDVAPATFAPDRPAEQRAIAQRMRNARTYYDNGRYQEARQELEQVYIADPFNSDAMMLLNLVYQKMYRGAIGRQQATVEEQFAFNAWSWAEPIRSEESLEKELAVEVKTTGADDVYSKLESTIIPNVEFDRADLLTVLRFLNDVGRRRGSAGVNIALGGQQSELDGLSKITMSFARIPLGEVIRYLCQELGLKYRVDATGVTIGLNVDPMQSRSFTVRADLISSIAGGGGAAAGGEAGTGTGTVSAESLGKTGEASDVEIFGKGRDAAAAPRATAINEEALKKYFSARGIPFGEGSTIQYFAASNALIVRNTNENLRRLEKLLGTLKTFSNTLVMVEIKMVEINETDWQELGFDWVFNTFTDANPSSYASWDASINKSVLRSTGTMAGSSASGAQGVTLDTNGNPITAGGTASASNTNTNKKLIDNLRLFPNFGTGLIDGVDINLALTINAVSQNMRTEVLSSPKIVSASGKAAHIKMAKQYYFPESWDGPEISTNNNFVSVIPPKPEWGDGGTDIGIIFNMMPTISADRETVTLHLQPEIASYIGQTDDVVAIQQGTIELATGKRTPYAAGTRVFSVWMPVIAKRTLDVTVKVADGETIVLGGMIDSKTETLSDKWPVLGEIPLIGRLFSSQYDKKKKTNMLIFVTARLVDGAGVPIKRNRPYGSPEFDR